MIILCKPDFSAALVRELSSSQSQWHWQEHPCTHALGVWSLWCGQLEGELLIGRAPRLEGPCSKLAPKSPPPSPGTPIPDSGRNRDSPACRPGGNTCNTKPPNFK